MKALRKQILALILVGALLSSLFPPLPPSLHAQAQSSDDDRDYFLHPPGAEWGALFTEPRDFTPLSAVEALDGGYIIVGATGFGGSYFLESEPYFNGKAALIKIDERGRQEFQKVYHGADEETYSKAFYVTPALDGSGYLIVGSKYRYTGGGEPPLATPSKKVWLMKVDLQGNVVWEETFDFDDLAEWGRAVVELYNGYYIAGGWKGIFGPEDDRVPGYRAWLFFVEKDDEGRPRGDRVDLLTDGYTTPIAWMEMTGDSGLILATGGSLGAWESQEPWGWGWTLAPCELSGNIVKLDEYLQVSWRLSNDYLGIPPYDCRYVFNCVRPLPDNGGFIATGYRVWGEDLTPFGPVSYSNLVVARINPDGDVAWLEEFGEEEVHAEGYSVVEADDGGFLVMGRKLRWSPTREEALWLLKLDEEGNKLWDIAYGRGRAWGRSLIKTSDGNYLVVGTAVGCTWVFKLRSDYNPRYPEAFFTFRPEEPAVSQEVTFDASGSHDPDGSIVSYEWDFGDGTTGSGRVVRHRFPTPGTYTVTLTVRDNEGLQGSYQQDIEVFPLRIRWEQIIDVTEVDEGLAMTKARDEGFVIAGHQYDRYRNYSDLWVFKADRFGRPVYTPEGRLWGFTRYLEGPAVGRDIVRAPDGGYTVLGWARESVGDKDVWLLKVSEEGDAEPVWEKTFGGPPGNDWLDYGFGLAALPDGYIITGYTESFAEGGYARVWLIRTDLQGNEEWSRTFSGNQRAAGYAVLPTSDGGYLIAGCDGVSTEGKPRSGQSKGLVIKTDAEGNELWREEVGGTTGTNYFYWADELPDGFLVAGALQPTGTNWPQAAVVKLTVNEIGDGYDIRVTPHYYNPPADSEGREAISSEIRSGIRTPDGGYLFVGNIEYSLIHRDIWVLKTDAEGELQWQATFGDPALEERGFDIVSPDDGRYVILCSRTWQDENADVWLFEIGPAVEPLAAGLSVRPSAGNASETTFYFYREISGGFPPYTYDLDFDGDGNFEETGIPSQIWEYLYTYYRPGEYHPGIRVTDAAGNTAEARMEQPVEVYGGPYADFVARPTSGEAPLTVFFDLRPASWGWPPIEEATLTYDLDVDGDGEFELQDQPSQIWEPFWEYDTPGIYSVTLRVQRSWMATGPHGIQVPVTQQAERTRQDYIVVGGVRCRSEEVTIYESHICSDPLSDPSFDLGSVPQNVDLSDARGFTLEASGPDGCYDFDITFDQPLPENFVLYKLPDWEEVSYVRLNDYTILVTLCIENGLLDPAFILARTLPVYTLTIRVEGNGTTNPPPGRYQFREGETVYIEAIPEPGETFLGWSGDASGTETGLSLTMDGDKEVVARFTGVGNRFPIIDSFTAEPPSGVAPLVVSFTCIAHDPDGTVVSYEWDFDGDGVVDETTVDGSTSHTYEGPGTYWAQVTVVDDRGASTPSDQVPIVVGFPIIAPGDVNQDGQVNSTDLALVARAFGSTPQSPNWNRDADLNQDDIVDIFDLVLVGRSFGRGVPSGRVFYVSPDGDDSNPGTREEPWASPGYGSRKLRPGDTLVILGGRYTLSEYDADIITPPSGEPGRWITIRGEEGNRPILAGRNNLLTAVDLSGCSYVRIENLEITSDDRASGEARYFRDGIEILGRPASHIVLKDLYIHHLDEFGMNFQDVEDLQILDCRIEYCGFGAIGGPEGTAGGWRNVLIRGCRLSYSGHYYQGVIDNPANPYDRPDGFGIEPSEGPVEIADTVAEHNKGDGIDSKARNTYIHNCIVANNSCDGIKLWGRDGRIENCLIYGTGDGVGGPSPWAGIVIDQVEDPGAYFEIVNTTVHDNPEREAYMMYVQYPPSSTPITLVMRNTIVAGGGGPVYIGDAVDFTADHCLFHRPEGDVQIHANGRDYTAAQIEAGELGPGNLSRDPLFVSPAWGAEGDYHLRPGSPAIDAGTCEGAPDVDLEYAPRPQGAACDIGAYETGEVMEERDTLREGEERTYTVGGGEYTVRVEVIFWSDEENRYKCKFRVNGILTDSLGEGESEILEDGVEIGVIEIVCQEFAGGVREVEFYLRKL